MPKIRTLFCLVDIKKAFIINLLWALICTEVHLTFCDYKNEKFESAGEWTLPKRGEGGGGGEQTGTSTR